MATPPDSPGIEEVVYELEPTRVTYTFELVFCVVFKLFYTKKKTCEKLCILQNLLQSVQTHLRSMLTNLYYFCI